MPLADWTVLIYSSASADLVDVARRALQEIAQDGHASSIQVAAQLGTPDTTDRFHFSNDPGVPPDIQHLPSVDMSSRTSLQQFVDWGQRTFPARHTLIVLGGHASGFMGAVTNGQRTRVMPPQDMVKALQGLHPDVVVINACLSQQMEVGLALGQVTRYLVASQAEEHQEGMALGRALSQLTPGTTPLAAALLLAHQSAAAAPRTHTVSAVDLEALKATAGALDQVGEALLAHPETAPQVRQLLASLPGYREEAVDVPLTDLKDVGAMARGLQAADYPRSIRQAARQLEQSLGSTVLATETTDLSPAPSGLSTWLPSSDLAAKLGPLARRVEDQYRDLLQKAAPHWVQALFNLSGSSSATVRRPPAIRRAAPVSAKIRYSRH